MTDQKASHLSALRFIDPIQVIGRVIAAETGAAPVEAFRTARRIQVALRRCGFDIVRRRFVAPGVSDGH